MHTTHAFGVVSLHMFTYYIIYRYQGHYLVLDKIKFSLLYGVYRTLGKKFHSPKSGMTER